MVRIMNKLHEQENQIREQKGQINRLHKGQKQLRTELECNVSQVYRNVTTLNSKTGDVREEMETMQEQIQLKLDNVVALQQRMASQILTEQQTDTILASFE